MHFRELVEQYKKGKRDFTGVKLTRLSFKEMNLEGINLQFATLEWSIFVKTKLSNANLKEVLATNTNFSGADLRNSDFEGADLRNSNFSHTNMQKANLTNALIEGAVFNGADLRGALLANSK